MRSTAARFRTLNPRQRAELATVINLLATPGLGTFLAGRRRSGSAQLALASIGFVGVCAYLIRWMTSTWSLIADGTPSIAPPRPWIVWGAAFFAVAWVWSAVSSLLLFRDSRDPQDQPPSLS